MTHASDTTYSVTFEYADSSNGRRMTKLHRQSDKLLDNYQTGQLSKGDAKFVDEFLKLERSEQLSAIRYGIREIHPQFKEPEIAKAATMILFKIQLNPHDATSFGMGTPK